MKSAVRSASRAGLVFALVIGVTRIASTQGVASKASAPAAGATTKAAAVRWALVTYLSGSTAYLDAGSTSGLREGANAEIVRGGGAVATLRISAVSSTRSAADILSASVEVAIGDSVRFVPAVTTETATRTATAARRRDVGLHGRVGIRYLMIAADGGTGLNQPAYDLRLDGQQINGSAFGLSADVRAQRTQYQGTSRAPLNVTRVYQAAVSWTGNQSGARVTLGRQMAGALSSVGLFDGLGLDLDRKHVSVGAFAGSQPDAASMGLSSAIREYGAYTQLHSAPGAAMNASVTVGGVGSYVGGEVDREYGFARFTSFTPWMSIYATQELDLNRGWKRDVEGKATMPTATFASVQVTPVRALSVFAGYDNRRSVRLYRDYLSPEQLFDDTFRQGMWGGVSLSAPKYLRVGADRRDSRGGSNGTAGATTLNASLTGFTPWRLGLRTRATEYTGSLSTGRLASAALELSPIGALRLEANGGRRETTTRALSGGLVNPDLPVVASPSTTLDWWGVDADVGIGRRAYLLLSTYIERQGELKTRQSYLSFSWRF